VDENLSAVDPSSLPPLPDSFIGTRLAVHALAEHVLCTVRYDAVGRIGLLPTPDGVATPPFEDRTVGLRGRELVDRRPDGERRAPVTTLRAAADHFGCALGPPPLWSPVTAPDPDAPLKVDGTDLGLLARWFALVADALATQAPGAEQTLWPEHFDLAVTVNDSRDGDTTFGGSPGDVGHDQPYLYVLPPVPVPDGDGSFWNEPFGAARCYDRVANTSDAAAFFADAAARIRSAPPSEDRR
jgi:hypothetical protein